MPTRSTLLETTRKYEGEKLGYAVDEHLRLSEERVYDETYRLHGFSVSTI
jgi:hypothetical protein